jgi:hypothetical protein
MAFRRCLTLLLQRLLAGGRIYALLVLAARLVLNFFWRLKRDQMLVHSTVHSGSNSSLVSYGLVSIEVIIAVWSLSLSVCILAFLHPSIGFRAYNPSSACEQQMPTLRNWPAALYTTLQVYVLLDS